MNVHNTYVHITCSYHSLLYHSVPAGSCSEGKTIRYKTLTSDKKLELLDKLVDAHVVRCVHSCHYHVYFSPVWTNSLIRTLLYINWCKAVRISEGLLYSVFFIDGLVHNALIYSLWWPQNLLKDYIYMSWPDSRQIQIFKILFTKFKHTGYIVYMKNKQC